MQNITMMKILTSQQLAKVIQTERHAQGLTQEMLAGLSGTGRRFIVDLEQGKETCQLGKVLKVLGTLGLDLFAIKRGQSSGKML